MEANLSHNEKKIRWRQKNTKETQKEIKEAQNDTKALSKQEAKEL